MSKCNRIRTTPMTTVPDDLIRTAGPIRLMLGAAPDSGQLTVGLLLEAPPPIGHIEIMLDGSQVVGLHHQLSELLAIDAQEIEALLAKLHRTR